MHKRPASSPGPGKRDFTEDAMRNRSSTLRPLEPLVLQPKDRPTGRLDDAPHMVFTRGLAVAVLALLLLTLVACGGGNGGVA